MTTAERLADALFQAESILAEAIANGEVKRGFYGIIIGDVFIANDGNLVYHVTSPVVINFLRGERVRELEKQITFYREELAKAEDTLAAINQIPN